MAYTPGSFGRLRVFEDFLGLGTDNAAWDETGLGSIGNIAFTSVNEGSFAHTVDEPGGILAVTTDTADDDNWAGYVGVFKPSDGGCVMEARFKVADITTAAVYCGFTETLSATAPVMPAEYATATLTCNGSGSMVGMLSDPDATTDLWRAVAGDGGVEETVYSAAAGPTNDYWDVVRVEIGPDGKGTCILNGKVIHEFTSFLTTTDIQHAVLLVENRSGAANTLEIDYFFAKGYRDWTDS